MYKCIKSFLLGKCLDNGFEDECKCDYTEVNKDSKWEIITDVPRNKEIIIKNVKSRKIIEISRKYFKEHFIKTDY